MAIKINVEDTKDVRIGDAAKVKATYFDRQKPYGMNPGSAVGDEVEVTLAKPLTGTKKKAPAKVAKPPKEKKDKKTTAEGAEDSPLVVQDLFGVDKPKDDKPADDKPKTTKKTTKKPPKDAMDDDTKN